MRGKKGTIIWSPPQRVHYLVDNEIRCKAVRGYYSRQLTTESLEDVTCLRCVDILTKVSIPDSIKQKYRKMLGEWIGKAPSGRCKLKREADTEPSS